MPCQEPPFSAHARQLRPAPSPPHALSAIHLLTLGRALAAAAAALAIVLRRRRRLGQELDQLLVRLALQVDGARSGELGVVATLAADAARHAVADGADVVAHTHLEGDDRVGVDHELLALLEHLLEHGPARIQQRRAVPRNALDDRRHPSATAGSARRSRQQLGAHAHGLVARHERAALDVHRDELVHVERHDDGHRHVGREPNVAGFGAVVGVLVLREALAREEAKSGEARAHFDVLAHEDHRARLAAERRAWGQDLLADRVALPQDLEPLRGNLLAHDLHAGDV
mmetsp:Transcript_66463/g.182306  ORF Transcript_66463/g.182306 Transcript_66463/m.182306 type:complete len:286 (-) Transcript_66463:104-961(-)